MDEDNSDDVVLIENIENEEDSNSSTNSRPLLALFERLISNDSKSNTVLTNAQILSILEKEFHMDIKALHELEVDIHINIVKKFLKDWPQWNVFDRVINRLKKKSAHQEIKNILEKKYKDLKDYLQSMIDIAVPLAHEAAMKIKAEVTVEKTVETESKSIVLEIYCTRKMLNKFIYNKPNPKENDSLFHLMSYEPYNLDENLPCYSIKSILHCYRVRLSIDLPFFRYTRFSNHNYKHVLVNEANGPRKLNTELDTSVYMFSTLNATSSVSIDNIFNTLDKITKHCKHTIVCDMIKQIFSVVKSDLTLDSTTVEVPGTYKQYLNKYPYVRKLYKEVEDSAQSPHNLYIEETVTPIQEWVIGKFEDSAKISLPSLQTWLKFECGECNHKFNGSDFLNLLRDHFRMFHMDEPDWTCTNCNETFTITKVTELGWRHECESLNK